MSLGFHPISGDAISAAPVGGSPPSGVPFDNDDSWWVGVNLPAAVIPIAASLAALVSISAFARQIHQHTDDIVPLPPAPISVQVSLFEPFSQRARSSSVFFKWPGSEELPAAAEPVALDSDPWQVYVPPLVVAQPLYLPDPDSFQPHTVLPESDWDVYTPPLGRAQLLYLPDGDDFRFTSPGQTITLLDGIPSEEVIGSHTISKVAAQVISPTGIASAEAHGATVVANVAARIISPTGIVTGEVIGSHTLVNLQQVISPAGIGSAESIGAQAIVNLLQVITPAGIASGEVIGMHTLIGGAGAPWIGGFYLAGEQVDDVGIVGAVFLNDATPVPGTATMIEGFAHTPDGRRYICFWPASGVVYYHRGIATRADGAMCIIVSPPECYLGGFGATNRGEICVALMSSDAYNWGIGVTTDGKTGVSSL